MTGRRTPDVEARLAAADGLRRGSPAERAAAHATYVECADVLDPARAEDAGRLQWALVARPVHEWDARPIARRAQTAGTEPLRQTATVVLGQIAANEGDADEAERAFRTVLAACRGTGNAQELLACGSLVTLYGRQQREFEHLLLSRRMADLARARGDARRLCRALGEHCAALLRLGDLARTEAALARLDAAIAAAGGQVDRSTLRGTLLVRMDHALARRDLAAAERWLHEAEAELGDPALSPIHRVAILSRRTHLDVASGRASEGARRIASGRDLDTPGALTVPWFLRLEVLCALERRGPAAAVEAARSALAALDASRSASPVATLEVAAEIGRLVQERCGDAELAEEFYDRAAAAILLRMAQLERCARELPELLGSDPDDEAALTAYRERFLHEQRDLLDRVRILLTDADRTGARALDAFTGESRLVALCAWCRRLRVPGGAWVPIGHYVADSEALALTHGICPTCLEGQRGRPPRRSGDAA